MFFCFLLGWIGTRDENDNDSRPVPCVFRGAVLSMGGKGRFPFIHFMEWNGMEWNGGFFLRRGGKQENLSFMYSVCSFLLNYYSSNLVM